MTITGNYVNITLSIDNTTTNNLEERKMKERFKNRKRILEVTLNREVLNEFLLRILFYAIVMTSFVALVLFIASIVAMVEAGTITRAIVITFLCIFWFVAMYFLYLIFFYGRYNGEDY